MGRKELNVGTVARKVTRVSNVLQKKTIKGAAIQVVTPNMVAETRTNITTATVMGKLGLSVLERLVVLNTRNSRSPRALKKLGQPRSFL